MARSSSTKASRKHAAIQRSIGRKTAEELLQAAAAVKAQSKRRGLVSVPKPAKAALEDTSPIPDCSSDVCSLDFSPSTPDLCPASPSGRSTGSFETDGVASCASSTSDDEEPVRSDASCRQQETFCDQNDPLDSHSPQVPSAGADKPGKTTGTLSSDIHASTAADKSKPQAPSTIEEHFDLFLEHYDVDASKSSSTSLDVQLDNAVQYRLIHNQVGSTHDATASVLHFEPWRRQQCMLENTLHIKDLPRDTAPRPSASTLMEQMSKAPHQREHYDVFLEHCAVEAKGGKKLSIEEELDVAARFLRIQIQVGKPHHTHANLVPWSEQPQTVDSMLPSKNLERDISSRPSQPSSMAEPKSNGSDTPCQKRYASIPQMIVYPLGVHEDPSELMEVGWTQKLPGQKKAVRIVQHQALSSAAAPRRSAGRWLRDLCSFGRSRTF